MRDIERINIFCAFGTFFLRDIMASRASKGKIVRVRTQIWSALQIVRIVTLSWNETQIILRCIAFAMQCIFLYTFCAHTICLSPHTLYTVQILFYIINGCKGTKNSKCHSVAWATILGFFGFFWFFFFFLGFFRFFFRLSSILCIFFISSLI